MHKHTTESDSHYLSSPKWRAYEIGACRFFHFTLFSLGMMRSSTPNMRGYMNVTVGGGPVGVSLPIGDPSATLGYPSLFGRREVPESLPVPVLA